MRKTGGKTLKDLENPNALFSQSSWTLSLLITGFFASLGSFNFGYNITVINAPAATFVNCKAGSDAWRCFPVSLKAWGLVVSIMGVGALVGSLVTGPMANRIGRKRTLIYLNVPYIIGFVTLLFAMDYWMLLIGRFLVGVAVGAACIVVPLYLSELGSLEIRGPLTSAHQLAICFGTLAAEMVGLAGLAGPSKWRLMFGLGIVPSLVQVFGIAFYAPESPRYLAQLGDETGTTAALLKLRRDGFSQDELNRMLSTAANSGEQIESWSFVRLVRNLPLAGRSLAIAMLLHLAQQFSGINVVFYFSSRLFATPQAALSAVPAAINILNLIVAIVAMWLVDRAGRRKLALISCVGMVLAGSAFTGFYLGQNRPAYVLMILLYVASFSIGMGPVPWIMMNEIFPTEAAGVAVSLAVATNWICNCLVGASFGWFWELLGKWIFTPYVLFTAGFTVYVWCQLPETKGRPLGFL